MGEVLDNPTRWHRRTSSRPARADLTGKRDPHQDTRGLEKVGARRALEMIEEWRTRGVAMHSHG